MEDFEPDVHVRLTRYLSGAYSGAEMAAFERWLLKDPARVRELDALRRVWEASAGIPPADRVDEMWRDLSRQLRASDLPEPARAPAVSTTPVLKLESRSSRRPKPWRRWGVGIAAAAGLAIVATYGVREYQHRTQPRLSGVQVAGSAQEYRTTRGQRGVIQLGDGTRIDLGVASVVRVHAFTDRRRDVELVEGQAAFQVTHDAARPFAVRVRNTMVEDLGTQFDVRAYPDERQVRVVVAEGKVALRADAARLDTTAVLVPGDLGVVASGGHVQIEHGVETERYLAWTSGRLRFDNAPLADVVAELERWYEVKLTIATPSLAQRRVTVSMPVSSLPEVLDAITAPTGSAYRWSNPTAAVLYAK